MNNLQKIASFISGYDNRSDFGGAKNDWYYDLETYEDKVNYIMEVGIDYDELGLVFEKEAKEIVEFLEKDFKGTDDLYWAFDELGVTAAD